MALALFAAFAAAPLAPLLFADTCSAQGTESRETPGKRRDNVLGTGEGNIFFGENPVTGDRTITVTPPAREDVPEDKQEYKVEPYIIIPPTK